MIPVEGRAATVPYADTAASRPPQSRPLPYLRTQASAVTNKPYAPRGRQWAYRRAAFLSLPGLVAPVSVVPSGVPLPVPALGVMPAE